MKTCLVVFAALCTMAFAQDHSVRVVDRVGQAPYISNPDQGFYQPSSNGNGPSLANPDPGFYQPSNGPVILPDNAFYRPSVNPGQGPVRPSVGPTFVNTGNRPYPYKQYDNPNARGGK